MYNALAGLGGAGQVDATAQNKAGIGLHVMFAVVGFIVGIVNNNIGTKWTMVCSLPNISSNNNKIRLLEGLAMLFTRLPFCVTITLKMKASLCFQAAS